MTSTQHRTKQTMTPNETRETTPRQAALVAGFAYVALFILGVFANFFVLEGLIETGDAAATAANVTESEGLFRLGVVAFLAIFLLDVVVAWALNIVFRQNNRDWSLLAAWFRIVYTVFLGVAAVFLVQALLLLGDDSFLEAVPSEQLQVNALVALELFNSTWLFGLAAFGLHLIVLGALVMRSRVAPFALGVVMAVSGTMYVVDTVANSLLSNYSDYQTLLTTLVAVPSIIGEGWFALWLLFRAARRP